MLTLYDLVARQAVERPTERALTRGDSHCSFREFQQTVDVWAAVLHCRGVRAGDSFGLVMRNSQEFVVTFFALARLGARAVPVNFLLKADEIGYIFQDAGVVGVITQSAFLGTLLEARGRLPQLRDVIVAGPSSREDVLSYQQLIASAPAVADLPRCTDAEAVSMIIYTSGTTGKPKGAMLTHRNFIANAEQCLGAVPTLRKRDVFLCLLPMFHSFAWTVCVILPIYLGCGIVIIESIQPFNNVIKQIFKRRVTIFVAVPPIYAALLRVPFWRPLRFLNPLRLCISGAAALPMPIHHQFERKFGLPLMEGYGLTEASPVVSLNPQKRRVPGTVGPALPGIELRIIDESGKTLPAGEIGEICLKGDNVMKGYFGQDAATREAFLDDALDWLRTGDVGFVDPEGYLHISDRKKDLIIVKGLNVYPKEVEDVLLGHAGILEAAVVGFKDETGDELVKAFVTLREGVVVEKTELMKLCRTKLAAYKCPKDLEICKELPKNTLGKILKRELRQK